MSIRSAVASILTVISLTAALSACSGNGDKVSDLRPRLVAAEKLLEEANRIDITIETTDLPRGVSGLKSATGYGNRTPAFSGEVVVLTGGISIPAEVVAVDNQVYAKTSFSPRFAVVDPASLGAPDPAALIGNTGEGLPSILGATKISGSKQSRDGKDVLTEVEGTISGEVIAALLPTADPDADFAVTYYLTDKDEVREAEVSGPFYQKSGDVTYRIKLTASDESAEITAPRDTDQQ